MGHHSSSNKCLDSYHGLGSALRLPQVPPEISRALWENPQTLNTHKSVIFLKSMFFLKACGRGRLWIANSGFEYTTLTFRIKPTTSSSKPLTAPNEGYVYPLTHGGRLSS